MFLGCGLNDLREVNQLFATTWITEITLPLLPGPLVLHQCFDEFRVVLKLWVDYLDIFIVSSE